MKLLKYMLLFSLCAIDIHARNHWMVTESGLIQPKDDSPFVMARPFDLLSFLNQETRWKNIINLYFDLARRQESIDQIWHTLEKQADITTVLTTNENCVKLGQLSSIDWYMVFLRDEHASERHETFPKSAAMIGNTDIPDCKKISSLTFSMFAFEHLEAMTQRENLTGDAEPALMGIFRPRLTHEQFGHWVTSMLKKNSTSWFHYFLASEYWRAKGVPLKAIECSRRAAVYAPRKFKDLVLSNIGSIFHRSKMTEDALILHKAAVEHNPKCPYNHFVVGDTLAILGQFNSSLKHFDQVLKLNPEFHLAKTHRTGVLCHIHIIQKLHDLQDLVKKLHKEILEYKSKEKHWLKSQAAFVMTLVQDFDFRSAEELSAKISELTQLQISELKKYSHRYSVLLYFLEGPTFKETWPPEKGIQATEAVQTFQKLIQHIINKHPAMNPDIKRTDHFVHLKPGQTIEPDVKVLEEIGPMPTLPDIFSEKGFLAIKPFDDEPKPSPRKPVMSVKIYQNNNKKAKVTKLTSHESQYDTGTILYPPTMRVNRNLEDFDKDPEWPTAKHCKDSAGRFPPSAETLYPIFLPFENKGIKLTSVLTTKIGVPVTQEHDVPWYPPVCPQDKEATFIQKKHKTTWPNEIIGNIDDLRLKLLTYAGDGNPLAVKNMQDAEIGHRIYAAINKNVAPKWVLYTLSALYWRVRGNNVNALHCLMTAKGLVAGKFRDVVMTTLASLYLEMGLVDEALSAAEDSYKIHMYEPATNFVLFQIHMVKKAPKPQMAHLKQAVRVDPNFLSGQARPLLVAWGCILKQVSVIRKNRAASATLKPEESCPPEPGMSVTCEPDDSACRMTGVRCFAEHAEGSQLVRMLELKDDHGALDPMDDKLFERFLRGMPADRDDADGHAGNYDHMMASIRNSLKGCGAAGCDKINPADLALKEEDCALHHMQHGYWLHVISFWHLIGDTDIRLPAEILSMPTSRKRVPSCRAPEGTDFFLQRMRAVDTSDWEPVLTLMHQFAEQFNTHDFEALGTKIAKYVDTRSYWAGSVAAGWWCGASGRGACAIQCLAAALHAAPHNYAQHALRALAALLHLQSKPVDGKEMAYLSFYLSPKNKINAFLVGMSHTYLEEYEQAVWMYRYALTFDDKFLPAKACLHATMCLMLFGDPRKKVSQL